MKQDTTRLNKYIALHLGISRRGADELIENGKVNVDGAPARRGQQVSDAQAVTVNNTLLATNTNLIYLMLNKPVGYVCSRREQGDTPTIYSLLPKELHHLKPVGRLDKDSSGLILLTNDGDFAHKMTHPSFSKTKVYEIKLNKELSEADFKKVTELAVTLDDGPSKFQLDYINDQNYEWKVMMQEGRNRQIRRTFESLGYNVTKLHRIGFDGYTLANKNLETGNWHKITLQPPDCYTYMYL